MPNEYETNKEEGRLLETVLRIEIVYSDHYCCCNRFQQRIQPWVKRYRTTITFRTYHEPLLGKEV